MTRGRMERSLVGPAGEHYVLFRLHQLGVLSALAPRNAPDVDVLVFADGETVTAGVQVKTRTRGTDGGWHMHQKHETLVRPRLFYAFVDLEPAVPVTHIVPSAVVAEAVVRSHATWLGATGKNGRVRKDSDMRRIRPSYGFEVPGYASGWLEPFKENWDQLLRASTEPD